MLPEGANPWVDRARSRGAARGLGLLGLETVLEAEVIEEGLPWFPSWQTPEGYGIQWARAPRAPTRGPSSACAAGGRVFGTCLHGLFDNDAFRGALLGLYREERSTGVSSSRRKEEGYDRLADLLRAHPDLPALYRILEASETSEGA